MAGGNGRQRQAVAPKSKPKSEPDKKPGSAGGNGKQREKK